ncbi:hypothetical protein [Cohnella boryungensis]|uniref:Uncharacterized protein n=1 Tax=Cohnella boryungensis TaxID=768479 RepID=A0ABV8SGI4_9BACL
MWKFIGGINLKPSVKYILTALTAVIVAATVLIVQRNFFQGKLTDYTVVNDGLAVTKEFNVKSSTPHQNSSVKGSILVWADKGMAERMRIVASYEIDPKDFGGMIIYIPKKWYISNILSSHPENQKTSLTPRASQGDNIIDEWRNRVEVGVDYLGKPSGGGSGTVVIDLVSDQKAILPSEIFNVMVTVGSDMREGVRSIGVGFIKIPISVAAEG